MTSTSKPLAVTFDKYGGPLQLTEWVEKPLAPKQLLVRVHACSINPIDFKQIDGKIKMMLKDDFPHAQVGYDVSGVVEKSTSDKFSVGQRVAARSHKTGTLASLCIVDEDVTALVPDSVSFVDAAAIPLAGQTALQALRLGGIKQGQTVLITGGAGGVGTYALQLAKRVFQCEKVVTTCSTGKVDLCKSLGADVCVDYTKEVGFQSLAGTQFDLIFDTVGNAQAVANAKLIKKGGRIISVAAAPDVAAFDRIGMDVGFLLRTVLNLMSMKLRWTASPGEYLYCALGTNAEDTAFLLQQMELGLVKSQIDTVYEGLDKFQVAFDKLRGGRTTGKIVICPQNEVTTTTDVGKL